MRLPATSLIFPLDFINRDQDRKIHNLLDTQSGPILQEKQTLQGIVRNNPPDLFVYKTAETFAAGLDRLIKHAFNSAKIVYWKKDIWKIATKNHETFIDDVVKVTDLPVTPEWWVWDTIKYHIMLTDDSEMGDTYLHSLLHVPLDRTTAIEVAFIVDKHDTDWTLLYCIPMSSGILEAAKPIKDDLASMFVASRRFLELPFVTKTVMHTPKHITRKKSFKKVELPEVTTVLLRSIGYTRENQSNSTGDIDWSYRWIVSGHWRNQWHPNLQKHSPVWVNSYIKGPEDKELKPPTQVIAKVVR